MASRSESVGRTEAPSTSPSLSPAPPWWHSPRLGRLAPLLLTATLALAAGLRAAAVLRAETIARDATVHLNMARALAKDAPPAVLQRYQYHPGYAATVAVAAVLSGADSPEGWARAGQWTSLAWSVLALAGLYVIARRAFGTAAALLAVALAALARTPIEVGSDALSEAQFLALSLWGLVAALWARGHLGRLRSPAVFLTALAGGLLCGGAYLTRPEGLLPGAIALVLLATGRGRWRVKLLAGLCCAAGLAACVAPYALTVGALTQKKGVGDFVAAGGAGAMLAVAGPAGELLDALRETLDRHVIAMGVPVAVAAGLWLMTWIGFGWLGIALPASVRVRPRRRAACWTMIVPALVMVPLLTALELRQAPGEADYVSSRHALLAATLLTPAAGAGLLVLAGWLLAFARRVGIREIPPLAAAIWLAVFGGVLAARATPVLHEGKGAYARAGAYVRDRFGPGRLVLASDSRAAFYAGAPERQFAAGTNVSFELRPQDVASVDALLARVRSPGRCGYRFVVVDTGLLAEAGPAGGLGALAADAHLELLATFPAGRGETVAVLAVAPPP